MALRDRCGITTVGGGGVCEVRACGRPSFNLKVYAVFSELIETA